MESKVIAQAKKNLRDYKIIERFVAGIVLTGDEIKSLRNRQDSINEAYVLPQQSELYVFNMNITAYSHASGFTKSRDTRRKRKLLLKRREINKLIGTMKAKN